VVEVVAGVVSVAGASVGALLLMLLSSTCGYLKVINNNTGYIAISAVSLVKMKSARNF
jgi:hypothetical protein